jgi:hypothetical protein
LVGMVEGGEGCCMGSWPVSRGLTLGSLPRYSSFSGHYLQGGRGEGQVAGGGTLSPLTLSLPSHPAASWPSSEGLTTRGSQLHRHGHVHPLREARPVLRHHPPEEWGKGEGGGGCEALRRESLPSFAACLTSIPLPLPCYYLPSPTPLSSSPFSSVAGTQPIGKCPPALLVFDGKAGLQSLESVS